MIQTSKSRPLLVTGGSGFVGKYVVSWLLERGLFIRTLVRSLQRVPFSFHANLELVQGDLKDEASLARAIEGAVAVAHLAADKYDPRNAYDVNVQGAVRLAAACEQVSVQRFINVSTQSAKIANKGVYGSTKRQAEEVFRDAPLQLTTLRPSLVYGPDERSLFGFIARQVMNLPVVPVLGSGEWRMRPVHVDDVAAAILACLNDDATIGKTYDVGGPDEVSLNEIIALIGEVTGKKTRIVHIPFRLSLAMAHVVAAILPNPPIRPDNVLGSNQETQIDIRPMLRDLVEHPIPLRDGTRLTILGKRYHPHTLKVAILGIGKIGLLHAAILNQLPEAQIAGIIDLNAGLRATAASMGLHVPFYTSLEQMLDGTRPDAVFICSPTFAHYGPISVCLAQGINILIEKPVTERLERSEELVQLAEGSSSLSAVGYFFRHRRTFRKAKDMLDDGILGTVRSFSASCYHSEVFGPREGWLFDPKRSGGGVLINPTSHLFDLLYWYFGAPNEVRATTHRLHSLEVEDTATVILNYADGLSGRLEASWSMPNLPILKNTIEIHGEDGTMRITHHHLEVDLRLPSAGLPAGRSVMHKSCWPQADVFDLNPQAGGAAYYLQDRAFVRACLGRPDDRVVSLREAVDSERIIYAAYDAAQEQVSEVRV